MKKVLTLLAVCFVLTGYSQTNTTTVGDTVKDVVNFVAGPVTNLGFRVKADYTPTTKLWGGSAFVYRSVSIGKGLELDPAVGVDYYNKEFYSFAGQLSITATLTPFSSLTSGATNGIAGWFGNIDIRPGATFGAGTPIVGGPSSAATPETYEEADLEVDLFKFLHGEVALVGSYGTRQGLGKFSGTFFGIGPAWHYSF